MRNYFIPLLLLLVFAACARHKETEKWTGTLEGKQIKVNALLGGSIIKLNVDEGDSVEAGDTLAVLDTRELSYQLEQLQATRQELAAQANLFNTQISQAEKDLAYQQTRQNRSRNLFQADAIARQNMEDAEQVGTKAESQLTAARQNLEVIAAKRKQLDAQEKTLRKKQNDGIILSPAAGTVSSLYYNAGEVIPPLGQLLDLLDNRQMEISVYVSESYLSRIKPGSEVRLYLGGNSQPYPAKVIHISNKAEFTPKTVLTPGNRSMMVYAVRLQADNPDGIMKDGMPADITFP